MLSAQKEVRQTWALPQGSSWPASETMGAHVGPQGALMGVAQALSYLPVGPMLPNEPGLPQASSSGKEHTVGQEPGCCRCVGAPLLAPRVCGLQEACCMETVPRPFPECGNGSI